jgi:hypothetical protein
LGSIANCDTPQNDMTPQDMTLSAISRPSEECCSQGGSFGGVQLEKRPRLSHKNALNQVIGFGRSSWSRVGAKSADRPE